MKGRSAQVARQIVGGLDQRNRHAGVGQQVRRHQPDRPRPDDDHVLLGFRFALKIRAPECPPP